MGRPRSRVVALYAARSGLRAGLLPWLMALLQVPGGGTVKIIEQGAGPPVVFLHSGVGSAGEWREVFSLWPVWGSKTGHRLLT